MKLLKNHQTFHATWHRKENEYSNLNELFSAIVVRFLSPSRKKSHKKQSRFASTITLRKNPKNRSWFPKASKTCLSATHFNNLFKTQILIKKTRKILDNNKFVHDFWQYYSPMFSVLCFFYEKIIRLYIRLLKPSCQHRNSRFLT